MGRFTIPTASITSSIGYSNGELDKEKDYVEAEAIKAVTAHAADEVLGPFYRWVEERERHQREESRKMYQTTMESMDDE